MTPPNPLKPIQEALERVLHESGLHDFGRSMSSIDDLTAEVQHVYQRVDDIERVLETIVPILERLTVVFEEIQADLEPMSELASKIPGSGSRRRRREKEAAALESGDAPRSRPESRGPLGPSSSGRRPSSGDGSRPAGRASASTSRPRGTERPADADDGPRSRPAASPGGAPPGAGNVRPGATGYSPLGSRDRQDR